MVLYRNPVLLQRQKSIVQRRKTRVLRRTRTELLGQYVDSSAPLDYERDLNLSTFEVLLERLYNFLFQAHSDIEGLIQNLTIMAALVATLCTTLATTLELPEFPEGNVKTLAMQNRGLRCHFAPNEMLDAVSN